MFGVIFAIGISVGLPITFVIYSIVKKQFSPFLLGVLTFIGSQMLIRIPILQYFEMNSSYYKEFSVLYPVMFSIIIGLSAGIFEEFGRYVMMRFLMKQRKWQSGFLFGAGHGGVEAVVFVGISSLIMLSSPTISMYSTDFLIGGIERFFAMMLHIGLSIIVLQGVVQQKFRFVLIAVLVHGFIDSLVGVLPIFMSTNISLIAIELSLAITAIAVFSYSLLIKRKEVL